MGKQYIFSYILGLFRTCTWFSSWLSFFLACFFVGSDLTFFFQVVMEYMEGGSLTEILDQYQHVRLTEDQIALILLEVKKKKKKLVPVM